MEVAAEACQRISGFYLEQGEREKAEEFRKQAEQHFNNLIQLREQAFTFSAKDRFAPHDLDETRVKELRQQLKHVRGLAAAYLVRKLIDGPTPVIYVLAVNTAFTWSNGQSRQDIDSLFDELSAKIEIPSPSVFLSLDGEHAHLLKHLCRIAGAELFATPQHGVRYLS